MSLESELTRYETGLARQFPEVLAGMNPGLGDSEIEELRAALAPLVVPEQVETMFRWRNGGTSGLFCGWRMYDSVELLSHRQFCLDVLGEPPAWLQLLDNHCLGFVTLGVAEIVPESSLWYCHSHDGTLERLFDSLESMVATCSDILEDGRMAWDAHWLRLSPGEDGSLEGRLVTPYRRARGPETFVWPNPPAGSSFDRTPEPSWPAPWLISLGMYPDSLRPHGATHTIADLIEAASLAGVSGTVIGRVRKLRAFGKSYTFTLDDGTAQLSVSGDPEQTVFSPRIDESFEVDVRLESASVRANQSAEPDVAELEAMVPALAGRLDIPGTPAVATALRPLSG